MAEAATSIGFASGTGEVIVTEHGGRVAELRPELEGPNLLWRGDTVAPITGGDRLWLAPERVVFHPEGSVERDSWRCPKELDPGSWTAEQNDDGVSLRQDALGADMRRVIRPLVEPPVACELPWAGYRTDDAVITERRLSGWHLIMVPAPSDLYVGDARHPVPIYGSPPEPRSGWLEADGTPPEWKLGLDHAPGGQMVLAALGRDDPGLLVVVLSETDPEGTYVDVPPTGGRPTAIQLYNSPSLGFCELEHHFPLESRASHATVFGAFGAEGARRELIERLAERTNP
ncbi:MAG: hypothetical protein KY437_00525 [Actinobacteria bacterium]|nr:hypothetical protein [Actinomycetota bacterium]